MNYVQYGAGLYDGKIKDSSGDEYDIGAVITMEGTPEREEIEVTGDDELKTTFNFQIRETISIEANALTFDVIQAITGNTVESDTDLEVPLGTDSEASLPYVEVQAFSTGKDDDGTAVTLKKTWHKVQLGNINISQSQGSEYNVSMEGIAFQTDEDIVGLALDPKRVATVEAIYS